MNTLTLNIRHQSLTLCPERAIFWQEQQCLILADLHIGKGGHFRKAGIPVPLQVQEEDLQRLSLLLHFFHPRRLLIAGDMFHAQANNDLERFKVWRQGFADLDIVLVKGNHDILKPDKYRDLALRLVPDGYQLGEFMFSHIPPAAGGSTEGFVFSGHLHPGVAIRGPGRQKLRFPCFWFSGAGVVLPAFSRFTGLHLIEPMPGDRVVAIVEDDLIETAG